jgi:hypothetical protein
MMALLHLATPGPAITGEPSALATPGFPRPAVGSTSYASRDWFGRTPVDRVKKPWQERKSGRTAMISSFLFPGLGQLYNEREFWSLVAAGIEFYFISDIIVQQRLTNHFRTLKNEPFDADDPEEAALNEHYTILFVLHRDNRVQSTWLLGLTILLSGLQAYVDAHLFDFEGVGDLKLEATSGGLSGGALRLRF